MSIIEGVVEFFNRKDGTGRNGKPYTIYSVKVDGSYYSFGFEAPNPAPEKGDRVKIGFETSQNGQYTNNDVKQFKILEKAPADSSAKGNGNTSSGGAGNQGMAWGNASNVAATLIAKMVDVDALPLTGAQGKANKAKRFDEFLEMFDKLRVKLYKDSLDIDRVLEQHADFGEVETNDPPELPEGEVADEEEFEDDDF